MNPGAVPNHHHFSNGTIITDDQSNTPCKHDLRWMGSEIFGDSWIINKTDFLNTIGDYFCEPGHIVANTTLNCVSITFYDYFRILTSFLDKSLNKNRKFFHNLVQHKKLLD